MEGIDSVVTSIEVVTPEMAQELLDGHTNFRILNKDRVALYAKEMRNGKWCVSQLVFDEDGKLLDGQHRLKALIASGTTQSFSVMRNFKKEWLSTIDSGQSRSAGQALRCQFNIKNSDSLAAILRVITNGPAYVGRLNTHIVEEYEKSGELAQRLLELSKSSRMRYAFVLGAFGRAIIKYPEHKELLFEALEKSAALSFETIHGYDMSPLQTLMRWLSNPKIGVTGKSLVRKQYYVTSKAIKYFLDKKPLKVMTPINYDPFEPDTDTNGVKESSVDEPEVHNLADFLIKTAVPGDPKENLLSNIVKSYSVERQNGIATATCYWKLPVGGDRTLVRAMINELEIKFKAMYSAKYYPDSGGLTVYVAYELGHNAEEFYETMRQNQYTRI